MNEKRRRANALMMKYYSGLIDEGRWKTAAGNIAVFNTKYRRNLKSLVVQLEPIQSGSGDPSPDNVRPITGWTGATVYRTGKNLWSQESVQLGGGNNRTLDINFSTPIPPGTYKMSFDYTGTATTGYGIGFYNGSNSVGQTNVYTGATTITSPATRAYLYMRQTDYDNDLTVIYNNMQLEPGTAATPYEPYAGTTIPVSWETEAGTVYGAELDVISGVLTVDRGYFTDDGSANWIKNNDGSFYLNAGIINPTPAVVDRCACNYATYAYSFSGMYVFLRQNGLISLGRDWGNLYADVASLKTAFAQTPFQIVYPLANSQTYQLTPQQIQTLIGENVIWSDAGPVSVEYWS